MTDLFPGLPGHLAIVAGLLLLLPVLPRHVPSIRVVASALLIFFNVKYVIWRYYETLPEPGLTFAYAWSIVFFAAEMLAVTELTWHALICVRLSDRSSEADRYERKLRARPDPPSVDVLIPTVNENQQLLDRCIRSALALDYPNFKVYVLDDGNRPWLRDLTEKLGAIYLTRPSRKGYKAGNVNFGLANTTGEFVLPVDADFKLYPNLLWRTVGFMDDPKIAIVQVPGNMTNPDPIQYNLLGENAWPEDQRVFTDIVQRARDTWDNAFCYGGVFLLRRSAAEEIGGIPEDSITEDLYSSYAFRSKGYINRYLHETLNEGLAPESIGQFIVQRVRWGLGTMQCMYLKGGPFRIRGLSLLDRLFYMIPAIFYLGFFWSFFVLIAPAIFWWTGVPPFNASVGYMIRMVFPRMIVTMLIIYWMTDRKVVPIVSDVGRVVGIFYFIPALVRGVIHPFGFPYQVTIKGESREKFLIQWKVLRGIVALGVITAAGLAVNVASHGLWNLLWDPNMPMILSLTVYVLWMLYLAALACFERPNLTGGLGMKHAATEGSFVRSVGAIAKRILIA